MKTIGLIGGMSWESSALYYQIINREVQRIVGGVHSAKCILYSVDFAEIAELQHKEDWQSLGQKMVEAAKNLEQSGADMIILCTNTMHKLSAEIENNISVPFLHIVDATAAAIQKKAHKKLGLVATKFSMEQDFLKSRYSEKYGIQIVIPNQEDRDDVHRIIYDELVKGIITDVSKQRYIEIINKLIENGAEGIISGCTEIELLIQPSDISVDLFQTTKLHAEKAVEWAITT